MIFILHDLITMSAAVQLPDHGYVVDSRQLKVSIFKIPPGLSWAL
jgi:hypothetical protein